MLTRLIAFIRKDLRASNYFQKTQSSEFLENIDRHVAILSSGGMSPKALEPRGGQAGLNWLHGIDPNQSVRLFVCSDQNRVSWLSRVDLAIWQAPVFQDGLTNEH